MTVSHNTSGLTRRRAVRAGLIVGVALTLAACGKKGPLEPAPGAPEAPKPSQQVNPADPGAVTLRGNGKKRPPPIQPPKDPFFLDFLL